MTATTAVAKSDNTKKQPKIGLIGGKSTGKTTLLASLRYADASKDGIKLHFRSSENDESGRTERSLKSFWQSMEQGNFPPVTYPYKPSEIVPYVIDVCNSAHIKRATLECLDFSGELVGIKYRQSEQFTTDDREEIFKALAKYDGIMCLLDPFENQFGSTERALSAEDIRDFFESLRKAIIRQKSLTSDVHKDNRITIPVAFCLSQADLPEHWPHLGNARGYAEMLWQDINNKLEQTIQPGYYEWYAISAIGIVKDHNLKIERSNSFEEINENGKPQRRILYPRGIERINVDNAIDWLLKKMGN